MVGTRRLEQLLDGVEDRLRLPQGPALVGLSGGADSAALAYLCLRLGRDVGALHVNHGLLHSPLMERAASAVAAALDLDLEIITVEVPKGPSPEGQARRARYGVFAEVEDNILTAHTRDDDVETVLFNLVRGTGPRGLAGIPYYRADNVYRPMLAVARSETREIASLAGLPFVDDPMNEEPGLARNIVRRRVIPMLSELNPRVSDSITRMSAAIAGDNEYLDEEAARVQILQGESSVAVAVGELVAVARPIADRVLKRMLAATVGGGGPTSERVQTLWAVARGEIASHQVGSGFVARREGALVVISPSLDGPVTQPVALTPGAHRVGDLEYDVVAGRGQCRVLPLSRWGAVFASGSELMASPDGTVFADGEPAWVPGEKRLPVAWYLPGADGYLSVFANEVTGWTSSR